MGTPKSGGVNRGGNTMESGALNDRRDQKLAMNYPWAVNGAMTRLGAVGNLA